MGLQRTLKLDYSRRKLLRVILGRENYPTHELLGQYMLPCCRLYQWKPYHDRAVSIPEKAVTHPLILENCAVFAVEEHLLGILDYLPAIEGYITYNRPRENGFRGQFLFIHKFLASKEVAMEDQAFIHATVFGLSDGLPWHMIAVYLPSGTASTGKRTAVLRKLRTHLQSTIKEPKPLVTIMAYFNMDEPELHSVLDKDAWKSLDYFQLNHPKNNITRASLHQNQQSLDHFVVSNAAHLRCRGISINRNVLASSHWPIQLDILKGKLHDSTISLRWNTKLLQGHGDKLALSHRWDCLNVEHINTEEDLDSAAKNYVEIPDKCGEELGIKQEVCSTPHKTLGAIKRERQARQESTIAVSRGIEGKLLMKLKDSLVEMIQRSRLKQRKFSRTLKLCQARRICFLLDNRESKDFHALVQKLQGKGQKSQMLTPCYNTKGVLLIDPKDILDERANYSKQLASDPEGISKNKTL
ncbi:hypothetical protein O181_049825 [Austropuccinia psidii MF-1]|uniref:Endonuclease/exonuclease/phosphatase domain-containing protein n=1 Tax=Austropuccinia psidii MF-1 TaxID=1389203 RepID=A0A9Q3DZY2_9BASI|nr:hypothetical protein [Austropuccinia psidii MF-1]